MKLLLGALGVGTLVFAGVGIANYIRENQIDVSSCDDDDEEDEVSEEEISVETQESEPAGVAEVAGKFVGAVE